MFSLEIYFKLSLEPILWLLYLKKHKVESYNEINKDNYYLYICLDLDIKLYPVL